jgi:hypothetical protein
MWCWITFIYRHVNFDIIKAVIVASPGFVKQQFFDYMYQQVKHLSVQSLQLVICTVLEQIDSSGFQGHSAVMFLLNLLIFFCGPLTLVNGHFLPVRPHLAFSSCYIPLQILDMLFCRQPIFFFRNFVLTPFFATLTLVISFQWCLI